MNKYNKDINFKENLKLDNNKNLSNIIKHIIANNCLNYKLFRLHKLKLG